MYLFHWLYLRAERGMGGGGLERWGWGGQHHTVDLACSGDGVDDDDDDEDANDLGNDTEDDAAIIERDSIRR